MGELSFSDNDAMGFKKLTNSVLSILGVFCLFIAAGMVGGSAGYWIYLFSKAVIEAIY